MSVAAENPKYGASWGEAILRFFANYSIFRGRASQSEYWWWALTNALVVVTLNISVGAWAPDGWRNLAIGLPLFSGPTEAITSVSGAIALIYALGTLLPNLAITWRRLHDTGRSGLWFFIAFVPIIGFIVLLVFLVGGPRDEGRRFD
jgi:uncharacterized membrane protein YhaH (DUF805 family)